jgi:hypothetical protein
MTPGCPTIQAAKISAGFVQVIPGCGGIIPGVVFKAQIKPDSAIRSQEFRQKSFCVLLSLFSCCVTDEAQHENQMILTVVR